MSRVKIPYSRPEDPIWVAVDPGGHAKAHMICAKSNEKIGKSGFPRRNRIFDPEQSDPLGF